MMPVILPTPDEFSAMSWHAQNRTRAAMQRLLRAYGIPTKPTYADRKRAYAAKHAAWAKAVRKEAKRLERAL
jgi:hypothetical protein